MQALAALHRRVVVALDRDAYQFTLSKIAAGEWRAVFSRDAMTSPSGYGVASAPWTAVQRAAWMVARSG